MTRRLRRELPPEEVFAKLREIGFDGVEFAGFGGRNAREIRKLLADSGLRGMGAHMSGIANFKGDKLKQNLDFCAEAGIESFTNAWSKFETADGWKRFGFEMGEAAEQAQAWKLPISFHNHFHEFTMKYDGVCAWDLVFQNSSKLLQQQLDSGQVVHPGEDCVERVEILGRNILHVNLDAVGRYKLAYYCDEVERVDYAIVNKRFGLEVSPRANLRYQSS